MVVLCWPPPIFRIRLCLHLRYPSSRQLAEPVADSFENSFFGRLLSRAWASPHRASRHRSATLHWRHAPQRIWVCLRVPHLIISLLAQIARLISCLRPHVPHLITTLRRRVSSLIPRVSSLISSLWLRISVLIDATIETSRRIALLRIWHASGHLSGNLWHLSTRHSIGRTYEIRSRRGDAKHRCENIGGCFVALVGVYLTARAAGHPHIVNTRRHIIGTWPLLLWPSRLAFTGTHPLRHCIRIDKRRGR